MKAKRVLCMLAAILLVVAMMLMFLTGCNRQVIDTTFSYDNAILLCISTMLRLLSISPVVQYSQLSEPFITKVIVSKKLATIFQTAN